LSVDSGWVGIVCDESSATAVAGLTVKIDVDDELSEVFLLSLVSAVALALLLTVVMLVIMTDDDAATDDDDDEEEEYREL
jgi:hypothetical protein